MPPYTRKKRHPARRQFLPDFSIADIFRTALNVCGLRIFRVRLPIFESFSEHLHGPISVLHAGL